MALRRDRPGLADATHRLTLERGRHDRSAGRLPPAENTVTNEGSPRLALAPTGATTSTRTCALR
jgi:hypothetical protein